MSADEIVGESRQPCRRLGERIGQMFGSHHDAVRGFLPADTAKTGTGEPGDICPQSRHSASGLGTPWMRARPAPP